METQVLPFDVAYDHFYREIDHCLKDGMKVLEIGGGAHPAIQDYARIEYTIVDPDEDELEKVKSEIRKINTPVERLNLENEFDIIISKMVLEHIEHPDSFHKKVNALLRPEGRAIHFFACRNSLPSIVNRLLPDKIGQGILKLLGNRNLEDSPKYKAYYRRTYGYRKAQWEYFRDMKYKLEKYDSFVGHKYFRKIPLLNLVEKIYSKILEVCKLRYFSTVALVVLQKEKK